MGSGEYSGVRGRQRNILILIFLKRTKKENDEAPNDNFFSLSTIITTKSHNFNHKFELTTTITITITTTLIPITIPIPMPIPNTIRIVVRIAYHRFWIT